MMHNTWRIVKEWIANALMMLLVLALCGFVIGLIYFGVSVLISLKYSSVIITAVISGWLFWEIDIKIEKVLMFYGRIKTRRSLKSK